MKRLNLLAPLIALIAALSCSSAPPPPQSHAHHHSFADAERWSKIFDDPARDQWQKPTQVIQTLRLKPESRVAEIGAGTGYFIPHLARAVPKGKVLALDIEPSLIAHMRKRFHSLSNVEVEFSPADHPGIRSAMDLVLLVDTYHHIEDRPRYFAAILPRLSRDGRLAIIDFKPESTMGPRHKFPASQVIEEMKRAGYELQAQPDLLDEQYLLIFKRLEG